MTSQNGYYNVYQKKWVYKRHRNFIQYVKTFLRNYCENTSLHGFRYIVENGTMIEIFFWLSVCVSAIIFCVILMLRLWMNFSNNPTVTVVDTANPIRELPFPAVTICNNNKVFKPQAEVLQKILAANGFDSNMSNKFFSSLMKLIRPDEIEIDNATASWALDVLEYTVDKLMYELMQPCGTLLLRCAWLGQIYDCNKIFKTVKSNEGFCCGFNYHFGLSTSLGNDFSWTMNFTIDGENLDSENYTEPLPGVGNILHAPGAGRDVGLGVALNIDGENYKSSVRPYIGATVLIHDAIDFPDVGAQSSTVLPGHVVAMSLAGTSIRSVDDVKNIPLQKRMCYFDGETGEEHAYSYQTCISKCMIQKNHGYCGCLPFFYPDPRTLGQIQISHVSDCSCLPQCNDKAYDVIAESILMNDATFTSALMRGLNVKNTSFLYVHFRDSTYLEYRRQSIMGWDGLLAAFGGIFGLCLGGSVISLVEFLYHLAMEFCDLRKKKQQPRKTFPPASEMFVSVPVKECFSKSSDSAMNNQVFLAWNENLHRRGQSDSHDFYGNGLRSCRN